MLKYKYPGKTARFINLTHIDQNYPPSDRRGIYFFVDNAQRLRSEKLKSVQGSLSQGKLCLAFSSSTYTSDGVSYLNCDFGAMDAFVPFTTNELESYMEKNFEGKVYDIIIAKDKTLDSRLKYVDSNFYVHKWVMELKSMSYLQHFNLCQDTCMCLHGWNKWSRSIYCDFQRARNLKPMQDGRWGPWTPEPSR